MNNSLVLRYNNLKQRGLITSDSFAARGMGYSQAYISQYLNGKFSGDIEKFELALESFLNLLQERAETVQQDIFFETANWKMVKNIANRVHVAKSFGVIIGKAGLGKTESLRRYSGQNPDVIYLEVDTAYSPRELMKCILREIGGDFKGTINDLKMAVIERLKGSGRLLIIDQAEYLSERSLDLLRSIHDQAKCGILIAGMQKLFQNLRGNTSVNEQIMTRVASYAELKLLTGDDVQGIVNLHLPESNGIWKDFYKHSGGNARVLTNLLKSANAISKGEGLAVTPKIVEIARAGLL